MAVQPVLIYNHVGVLRQKIYRWNIKALS